MNPEKYTERARGFIQAAQNLAQREGHQQLTPQQYARLAGVQLAVNRAFQEVIDKSAAGELNLTEQQLEKHMEPQAMLILRGMLDVFETEQLVEFLILRGALKEGQTLKDYAATLPPKFRAVVEQRMERDAREGS